MNLDDEIICGHFVPAAKKRVFAVYLDLLREFDRLCRQNRMTWWIGYGSLIGAVRHGGFIPWDDDVDVQMPRRDFDRLLRMTGEEFGARGPYFLQTPRTEPLFQQRILRFRRSDTSYITPYDLNYIARVTGGKPYNMGLAIGIFPVDNYPKSRLLQKLQHTVAHMGAAFRMGGSDVKRRPLLHAAMKLADRVVSEKMIVNVIHGMYRLCPKNRSGYVQAFDGFYPGCTHWPAEVYRETVYLPFEDMKVPAPVGYDTLLRISYGDYTVLPPAECREDKHEGYMSADVPYTQALAERLYEARRGPEGTEGE